MAETQKLKHYDLEDRTFQFAKDARGFVRAYKKESFLYDDLRQLVRASGSVGANYIEANDALSKKDFLMRIKICKKEAKECRYWLRMVEKQDKQSEEKRIKLEQEATELTCIFAAILRNSE